jgi:hypothetical protein
MQLPLNLYHECQQLQSNAAILILLQAPTALRLLVRLALARTV